MPCFMGQVGSATQRSRSGKVCTEFQKNRRKRSALSRAGPEILDEETINVLFHRARYSRASASPSS